MPSSVRGNWAKLAKLRRDLELLASNGFQKKANAALAREGGRLAKDGFQREMDPYGNRWPPRVGGGSKPLLGGPGRVTSRPTASGFALTVGVPWMAETHQRGKTISAKSAPYLRFRIGDQWVSKKTVKIPRRSVVPWPGRGLGTKWDTAFRRVLRELMQKVFGKK